MKKDLHRVSVERSKSSQLKKVNLRTKQLALSIFINPVMFNLVYSAKSWTSATRMATSSSKP
jgi:hypothetical protein